MNFNKYKVIKYKSPHKIITNILWGFLSMILLPKKRILFIILVVFVSVFTYFLGTENSNKTLQTVSLPVTNKVVVLDAGHGRRR